jgi:ABC-2 type transport system permease protein
VLAWALVWFVLGYALYATVYGALGSLGSRVEDAQAVAGPRS